MKKEFKTGEIKNSVFCDPHTEKFKTRYYQQVFMKSSLKATKYTLDSIFYGDSESEVSEKVKNYTK